MELAPGPKRNAIRSLSPENPLDPNNLAAYPAADLTLERIGDLVECDLPVLLRGVAAAACTE